MVADLTEKPTVPFTEDIMHIKSFILESLSGDIIKKIILFGSHAYGMPNKNSDIDLCVIIEDKRNSRDAYLKIALALFNHKITSTDLLVYRENDFSTGIKKNEKGIESVINSSGRVLYTHD